jgi:hypothetical protein
MYIFTRNSKIELTSEDIKAHTFTIEDIAFGLAHINRFNGAAGGYSVAQHSVNCVDLLRATKRYTPLLAMATLLHDAHEVVVGDIIRPIKTLFLRRDFMAMTDEVDDAITRSLFPESINVPTDQLDYAPIDEAMNFLEIAHFWPDLYDATHVHIESIEAQRAIAIGKQMRESLFTPTTPLYARNRFIYNYVSIRTQLKEGK